MRRVSQGNGGPRPSSFRREGGRAGAPAPPAPPPETGRPDPAGPQKGSETATFLYGWYTWITPPVIV